MKNMFSTLRTAVLLFMLVGSVSFATAQSDFWHKGLKYHVTGSGTVQVIDCDQSIKSVVIPSSLLLEINYYDNYYVSYIVTSIASNAFTFHTSLNSIELPNTVTYIGQSAFYGCSALTDITLSNTLNSIGEYAFGYCTSLKTIYIPNSVTTMGWNVFYGCTALTDVSLSNHLRELNGTFDGCTSLESVRIPNSVVSLNSTFSNCTSLYMMAIPNSVSSIGEKTFMGCSGLKSVNIPNSVTKIGNQAFSNTGLTSVVIPNTVTNLGVNAFEGCLELTSVTSCPVEPPMMSAQNTFDVWIYENAKLKVPLIAVTTYKDRNWWKLFQDVIGDELLNNTYDFVADGIYYNKVDDNSVEITFKDNNYNSYSGTVTVPAYVTNDGRTYSVTGIGNYAFYNCQSLTGVTLPASITSIGSYAFANAGLTTLNLPGAVTTIATRAFYGCTKLSSLTIPNNVTSIGKEAFAGCDWLTQLAWNARHCWTNGDLTTNNITKVSIGNNVEILPDGFVSQSKVSSIIIPASVTTIGCNAFYGCSLISSITIPKSISIIGTSAFSGCTGLTELIWNAKDCLKNGDMCTEHITHATIGNEVETLPIGFLKNSQITTINLPNSVKRIGPSSFYGCHKLSELLLPESIRIIDDDAFYGCNALVSLTIPRSVISIGSHVFDACDGITTLNWNAINCGTNGDLLTQNLTQINIGNEVKKIPINFAKQSKITSVTIPNSVDSICSNAFAYCYELSSIIIPNSVTEIGRYAFSSCTGLKNITLGASVERIDWYAFYGCTGLTSLVIPDNVKAIDWYAFSGCTGLTSVTIGPSVEYIYCSFSGCSSLATMISLPITPPNSNFYYNPLSGVPNTMVIYVLPDALDAYQSNNYWGQFTILPANIDVANLTVNLPEGTDVEKYADMKLGITSIDNDNERHFVISNKLSYVFSALDYNTSWDAALTNQYGDILGKIEGISIGEEDVTTSFISLKEPQTVTMVVKTPDGQDVTDQSRIDWFDQDGELLTRGKQIGGLPAGKKINYNVKLPQELATSYSLPANMSHTVKDGANIVVCQLTKIAQAHLSGNVMISNSNEPLYGASISATQTFAGGDSKTVTTSTDRHGAYSLDVSKVPTFLTFSAQGYVSQALNCDDIMTDDSNITIPDIKLSPYEGVVVMINMTFTPAHVEGEVPEIQNWYSDYNNVDFEVYNKTNDSDITNISLEYPRIVLMESVNDGDVLELTARSRNDAFKPVKTTVTVANHKATATFNILERGKIMALYRNNINPVVAGTLYGNNGYLKRIGEYSDGTLKFDNLDEGEYTLITMGEKGSYNSIFNINQLEEVGLIEGVDYVRSDVFVEDGIINNVTIDRVPFFEPDGFISDYSSFTVNKPNLVIGNFQTFRAQFSFKEQYANLVTDVKLIIDLPDNCSFIENSVQIGSSLSEYSIQGNRVIIPIENRSGIIRSCAIPTEPGVYSPNAFVQFCLSDETITVPIGNAQFTADALSITAPSTVNSGTIPVSGTAIGPCSIEIYDNDVLIGQTMSIANGDWSTICNLHEPYNITWHDIHAKVTTEQGLTLLTENISCLCDMDAIQVKKVKMYHYNPSTQQTYEVEYDFQNPTNERQSWVVYYPKKVFTFTIDFTNNSPDILSNIVLHVHTADGCYLSYYPEYDPEQDLWVVNCDLGDRSDGKYPVNVSLDYDANISFNSVSVNSLLEGCANQLPINGVELNYINEQDGIINAEYTFYDTKIDLTTTISSIDQIPLGIEFEQDTVLGQMIYTYCNDEDNSLTTIFPRGLIDMFCSSSNEETIKMYNWADSICTKEYLQIKEEIVKKDNALINTSYTNHSNQSRISQMESDISTINSMRREINELQDRLNELELCLTQSEKDMINQRINHLKYILKMWYGGIIGGSTGSTVYIIRSEGCDDMVFSAKWFNFTCELVSFIKIREVINAITNPSIARSNSSDSNMRSGSDPCNRDPHPNEPGDHRPNRPNDNPTIDPAGFVYEGVPSHRLEGVIATCYYKETIEDMYGDLHDEIKLWDAEQYGQENPLLTNDYGYYHWDVPVGMWQVKYEKAGYETTYSDWLPVPPPQLQVNIGMVQMRQPEVIKAHAYPKAVEFEFDKFMLSEDLTSTNIKVIDEYSNNVYGSIELLNLELDDPNAITSLRHAPGTGGTYASKVRFNAFNSFYGSEVTLRVSKRVKSYANVEMSEDYIVSLPIEQEMQIISVDTTLTMLYGDNRQLTVTAKPASASRGKTLNVRSSSPMIISTDANTYTLDNNGKAVVTVQGDLPGMGSLLYGIDGYDLTASTLVNVMMESQMTVSAPTASILSGNEVDKGTEIYLNCQTPRATIYYTLDGSCPCDDTPARKVYDGLPIIINTTTTIKAMASAPDLYDSDVATFVYRVPNGLRGDVNGDGEVNIADVNALLDIVLGGQVDEDTRARADVNADDEVNIADINAVIELILNPSNHVMNKVNCNDLLHIDDVTIKQGDIKTINVTIDNASRYSAMQCDIVLPAGLTLVDILSVNGHINKTDELDENTMRAVNYSMDKRSYSGDGSPVMSLTVLADADLGTESEIKFTNVVLADAANKAWRVVDCTARISNTTGINDLTASIDRVWVEGNTLCIETRQDGVASIAAINGVTYDLDVKAGVNRYVLDAGLYVVVINGKGHKIAVK